MKINLKENIWIEGFDQKSFEILLADIMEMPLDRDVLYIGVTYKISEEIAKKYVHFYFPFDSDNSKLFKDYSLEDESLHNFETAKESILSACEDEYCIIYKQE